MKESAMKIDSHVIPVYHDWDLKHMWKLIKPTINDNNAVYRVPDGEPSHWDIVLVRGEKSYERASEEYCECDLRTGAICSHWREIRV